MLNKASVWGPAARGRAQRAGPGGAAAARDPPPQAHRAVRAARTRRAPANRSVAWTGSGAISRPPRPPRRKAPPSRGKDAAQGRFLPPAWVRWHPEGVFCHRSGATGLGKGRSTRAFSATGWGLGSWGALIAIRSRSGGWGGAEGGGRAEMRMFYPTFIRHQTRPPQEGAAQGGAFPVCGRGVFSLMMSGVATRARCTASVSTERSLALDPQQRRSRKTSSVDSVRLQQHHLCGLIAVFQLRFLLNRSNASSRKFSALRLKSSSRRARPSSEQDGALQRAARRHSDAKGVL